MQTKRKRKLADRLRPYLFTGPAWLIIGGVVLFPILYMLYISFTNLSIYHWEEFQYVGFNNYVRVLADLVEGFFPVFLRTVVWTALNMVVQIFGAFLIAMLLNTKGLRGGRIYRTLLMIPWAVPAYLGAFIWRNGFFDYDYGLINQLLNSLGITPVRWLANNPTAFVACLVVNLWLSMPFMILVVSGAMQSIDDAYYENALIEGAGWFQRAKSITFPLVMPVIRPAVLMTTLVSFKQFDIIFIMTLRSGNRTGATIHTVMTYAYEKAFVTNNYGLSSAISVLVFLIIMVYTVATTRSMQKKGEV